MRNLILLLAALVCLGPPAEAETVSGLVTDTEGNPLPSVSVVTNHRSTATTTDEFGGFDLEISEKITSVTFSSVGYKPKRLLIEDLPSIILLETQYYPGTDILVTGGRAEVGVSTIAYSNFSRDDIERDYAVGELPLLLETSPNLFTYSDGGASLGYTYTSIRGFDDKRITTYINGVPLNDPEWQVTYFVDLPDFAANIDDIQVQRGIGNSLYGDASFGGTINVVTNTLSRKKGAVLTTGYGQYTSGGKSIANIYRSSLEYSSGLINGRWHLSGRYSKQHTDGYRQHSWYDGSSYYFALARLDKNMTTELYVYGGPIKMHLAFWGATRESITANRRSNSRSYANETDNFNQPHVHLHNSWQLSENMLFSNTLYYIRGKGHYEQLADSSYFEHYDIDPAIIEIDTSTGLPFETGDLVRQDLVEKSQFGWNSRLETDHAKGRHVIGGSVYFFTSDHDGRVTAAQHTGDRLRPGHHFYQWAGQQWVGSLYGEERVRLSDRLSAQLTAQIRYQKFDLDEDKMGAFLGHKFDMDWLFFSPRLGFSFQAAKNVRLFTNLAVSSRPPVVATIYDGTDPTLMPLLEVAAVGADSTSFVFGKPLIKAERVFDIELGGEYRTEDIAFSGNLFWMDFWNEILSYGPVNPFSGLRSAVNADRTVHAGIELDLTVIPSKSISIQSNLSYNYNRIKDFSLNLDGLPVDFAGKQVAGFPDVIGNLIVDFKQDRWRLTHRLRMVGRRYMELQNDEELSLDPYFIGSLSLAYTIENLLSIGNVRVEGRIDNWADKKYETYGYGGNYAYGDESGQTVVGSWAEYYVAAERSFYLQVAMELF